jgi:elongation factor Ts
MTISLDQLKKLREETSAGVMDCRQALEEAGGDYEKAKAILMKKGLEKAAKKEGKETKEGIVESYVHANGKVGVLVTLYCETDFVALNDEFKKLAHEVALQIAAMDPKDVKDLLKSSYIRDSKLTMADVVKITISKVGENITIGTFSRITL